MSTPKAKRASVKSAAVTSLQSEPIKVVRPARAGQLASEAEQIRQFNSMAKTYAEKYARSAEEALAKLQNLGIVKADGRLTKNYK